MSPYFGYPGQFNQQLEFENWYFLIFKFYITIHAHLRLMN